MAETDPRTSTDTIIEAMEHADDMECVIIIYRLRDVPKEHDGVAWFSNVPDTPTRAGMLEMAKHGMLSNTRGDSE